MNDRGEERSEFAVSFSSLGERMMREAVEGTRR